MPECPECGKKLKRVHRKFRDRLISLLVPLVRYKCQSYDCGWEGLLKSKRGVLSWTGFMWIAIILGAILLGQLVAKMGR